MKRTLISVLATALLMTALRAGVSAQVSGATAPYVDTACGAWQGDTWVPNGDCPNDAHKHARMEGTIVFVKGHLVTVQQSSGQVVINDQPALNNKLTGKVAVGRSIVAHGYWDAGTFYATLIATNLPGS